MASRINADSSNGLQLVSDSSGEIQIQSNGVTVATINSSGLSMTGGKTVSGVDSLSTASGSAPSYSARAWVNFNGTGTVAIRGSANVSSITDNGIGDYIMNFTTAMQDVNYTLVGACADESKSRSRVFSGASSTNTTISTSAVAITIDRHDTTSRDDMSYVYAAVFR